MKVYLDKLPEECAVCACCDTNGAYPEENESIYCNLLKQGLIKRGKRKLKDCPLKLISEVKKQERERVIDLIDDEIDNQCYFVETADEYCAVKTRPIKEFMKKLEQEDTNND